MYAGLTPEDKKALEDAKARGAKWVARDGDDGVVWAYADKPTRLEGCRVWDGDAPVDRNINIACKADEPVNIDRALAQIAEMEKAEKPMTVDQWLNQATPEQKAEFVARMSNAYVDSESGRKSDLVCVDSLQRGARTWLCDYPNCEQCFATFFNSPYTEGETE